MQNALAAKLEEVERAQRGGLGLGAGKYPGDRERVECMTRGCRVRCVCDVSGHLDSVNARTHLTSAARWLSQRESRWSRR